MATAVLRPNPSINLSSPTSANIMDNKSSAVKQESATASGSDSKKSSPVQSKSSVTKDAQNTSQSEDSKAGTQVSEPLAPPPKPAANAPNQTPDYFSAQHTTTEFNPFEQSFGAPSSETPGKTLLPPVAALESPAIPGTNTTSGYWGNQSLRAGPLSPAMLEGPAGSGDYFGNISRGFPTPNESSLRTGLTPGGGGSMFPAPSPGSQALFNSLQSGGATPGTLDFHRTAMNAAARNKQYSGTSNPQEPNQQNGNMDAQHDATDAANGLFMLAKGGQANQFAVPNQSAQQMQTRSQGHQRNSSGSNDTAESPEDADSKSIGRNKKGAKGQATANGRRKSEAKQNGNKRQKGNTGSAIVDPALDPDADPDEDMSDMDDDDMMDEQKGSKGGKKMTDEEKRRNFLERNRVAALKCRQRKKQWLANLQAKVEMYSAENDSLTTQVGQLHEEIRNLRNLLIQHKDCPVGHAQGIGQFLSSMQDPSAAFAHQQMNPYGMAMPNGAAMQAGMQRS